MIMQIMRGSYLQIGVIYKIVPLATLKLSCFRLRGLNIIAFSQVFGHSVNFCSTWAFMAWLESSCFYL